MDTPEAAAPVANEPASSSGARRSAWSRLGSTTWLGIFIGAVVVVATAIVLLAGNRPLADFPADSPEGAFQRYLVAWYDEDYETAYEYFSSSVKTRMSYSDFTAYMYGSPQQSVTINRTSGTGDRRHIFVTIEEFYGMGPGSSYSREESVSMVLEGGAWKIDEPLSGVDPNYNAF